MSDFWDGPATGVEALRLSIVVKDHPNLFLLSGFEAFGATGNAGSAQCFLAITSELSPPHTDSDFSDAKLLRQVTGRATGVI